MINKDKKGNIVRDETGNLVKYSGKFTVEDFNSTESVDTLYEELDGDWSRVDSEGYTPTCFAILNGIKDEDRFSTDNSKKLLTYTVSKGIIENPVTHEKSNPSASLVCNKGKSPLQYACMTMRADATSVLLDGTNKASLELTNQNNKITFTAIEKGPKGNCIYVKITKNTYNDSNFDLYIGNSKDLDKNDLVLSNVHDFNTLNSDLVTVSVTGDIFVTEVPEDGLHLSGGLDFVSNVDPTKDDILSAASLNKSDILGIILNYYRGEVLTKDDTDSYNNNAFHLISMSQCYGSADLIINHIIDKSSDPADTIKEMLEAKNDSDSTPINIAESNNDIGMLEKFGINSEFTFDKIEDNATLISALSSSLDTLIGSWRYKILNKYQDKFSKSDLTKIYNAINSGDLVTSKNDKTGIKNWPSVYDKDFITHMCKEDKSDSDINKWLPVDQNGDEDLPTRSDYLSYLYNEDKSSFYLVLSYFLDRLISCKSYELLNQYEDCFSKSDLIKIYNAIKNGSLKLKEDPNKGIVEWPYNDKDANFIDEMYSETPDEQVPPITKWIPRDLLQASIA